MLNIEVRWKSETLSHLVNNHNAQIVRFKVIIWWCHWWSFVVLASLSQRLIRASRMGVLSGPPTFLCFFLCRSFLLFSLMIRRWQGPGGWHSLLFLFFVFLFGLFSFFSLTSRRWQWPGGWHGRPWSPPSASWRQKAHWLSPPWDQQSKENDESVFKIFLVESRQMTRFTLVVAPMRPSRTKTESPSLRKMNPKRFSLPLPNLDKQVMVRNHHP